MSFPLRSICRLLALLLVLLAGACVDMRDPAASDAALNALFTNVYGQIGVYYIDPVSFETLALAGIGRIGGAEGAKDREDFSASRAGNDIVFTDATHEIGRMAAPGAQDAHGWAAVTVAAADTARAHLPAVAELSDEQVVQRIFDGLLTRLDRFSHYAGPKAARDQRALRDGFGGIGITLDATELIPRVSSVQPDSPAARAHIQVGDLLLSLDDIQIRTMTAAQLLRHLIGPVGTKVTVVLLRPGREPPLQMTLTRTLIVPRTVTVERYEDIAVFRISVFNHNTAAALGTALTQVRTEMIGLKGVVLDLRDNPGGLLDQAVDVAELFLDSGQVVSTRGRHPTAMQQFSVGAGPGSGDRLQGLPMVVLVDGASASASEIVSAALQDDGRALIVGSSSFGKGTVQMVLALKNGAELTLTWAKLITPDGYILHEHGVVPAFCTDNEDPATITVDHIIDRGLHQPLRQPRTTLDDAQWAALRAACPPERRAHPLDLGVAEQLLRTPSLYAQAMANEMAAHIGDRQDGNAGGHAVRAPQQ